MKAHAPNCDHDECRCGPEPTRYFTDGLNFWKFAPDEEPMIRAKGDSNWGDSVYTSLEEFLEDPVEVDETNEEEAEP